jgi:tRNA dimethylallyltransferase
MALTIAWKALVGDFPMGATKPLIVVLGPTASGKTAFSGELVRFLRRGEPRLSATGRDAEIVNADSRQLYRLLDIGTAKPTTEERRGVPHHLFDVLDPSEEVTVAWYQREAERVIGEIHARGRVPVLVGGSMLYIDAIVDGLTFAPQADPSVRRRLNAGYDRDGAENLYRRLRSLDPETASSVDPRNRRYLIRALEIVESTGQPASMQRGRRACPYDLLMLGVRRPRAELHRRIAERTRAMLASGWIGEVQGLLAKGYATKAPALQSLGYREIAERLLAGMDPASIESDVALIEQITAKTRKFAKRQMTWWRSDPRIRWIDPPSASRRRTAAWTRGTGRSLQIAAFLPRGPSADRGSGRTRG